MIVTSKRPTLNIEILHQTVSQSWLGDSTALFLRLADHSLETLAARNALVYLNLETWSLILHDLTIKHVDFASNLFNHQRW